jgi:hypothetical protein
LLSETANEDSHWPPELILLREKFTAKSQLEIAQLQIKHEEEVSVKIISRLFNVGKCRFVLLFWFINIFKVFLIDFCALKI